MKLIVLALACLAVLASAQVNNTITACTESGFVIDDFAIIQGAFDKTEAIQSVTTTTVSTHPVTGAARNFVFSAKTYPPPPGEPTHILGGYRDVIVYIDQQSSPLPSPGQGVRININVGQDNQGVTRPQLRYSTDQGITGIAEIQWDGNTDSANPRNFVRTGLGGINLAATTNSFTIDLEDTDLPSRFRVEAWSYAGGVAANSQGVYFEWDPSTRSSQVFQFTDFIPISGSINPVSVFQSLGALRLFIRENTAASEIDLTIFSVAARSQFCLWKAVAETVTITTVPEDRFPLFFGTPSRILTGACDSTALNVGDRVTFFLQSYSEQPVGLTYQITDALPAGLSLVAGSISTFTHGATISQVRADILNGGSNTVLVNVTIANTVTAARVSVFFDAIVTAAAIASGSCQGVVPNRASLNFGSVLQSVNYNGVSNTDAPTNICVVGDISFAISQTITPATLQVGAGETFTVNTNIRNTGDLTNPNTILTCTVAGAATLTSTGWTRNGNVYTRNVGSLAPSTVSTNYPTVFTVNQNAGTGNVSVQCCVSNSGQGLPASCTDQRCISATVRIGSNSDVKLCKRGELRRRLIYEVDYWNCGDGDARDVIVVETIPVGTIFNPVESDSRWVCNSTHCVIVVPILRVGTVECAIFVVDINDSVPACTIFNNTVVINVTNPDTVEEQTWDNWYQWSIQQEGCPIPLPPPPPQCCDCPLPPPPPAMCPCPEPDPCEQCWEQDDCDDHDECGGHGHHGNGATTINFDFSGEDCVV